MVAREVGPEASGGSPPGPRPEPDPIDAAPPTATSAAAADADPHTAPPGDAAEPAGIADELLRPALELGFAVALVLSRQRPPLPVPAALRPYLRFQKLPSAALGPLRRVLTLDGGFRERVAMVADEAIVGRPSWLWLVRPVGWESELSTHAECPSGADIADIEDVNEVADADHRHDRAGRPQGAAGIDDVGAAHAASTGPVRRPVRRTGERAAPEPVVGDRKLAKRLEAAEQALVRAKLEAEEARTELVALRSRRDDDAIAVPKLTAKVAQLDTELRGARRRLEDVQRSLTDATTRAEEGHTHLVEARGALARTEQERDDARGQADQHRERFARLVARVSELELASTERPSRSPAPIAEQPTESVPAPGWASDLGPDARDVLREVAGATRRLGDVLDLLGAAHGRAGGGGDADAGDGANGPVATAVTDRTAPGVGAADTTSTAANRTASGRRSRPARQPLVLPGGVLAESVRAVEHLLRHAAIVLVDGYNVAKLGWPALGLPEQRSRLLAVLDELEARFGGDLRVVFDGSDVTGPTAFPGARRRVSVAFSPAGVLADDVLVELVRAQPTDRPVVVVTNDQELRSRVRVLGANLVGSEQLLAAARR